MIVVMIMVVAVLVKVVEIIVVEVLIVLVVCFMSPPSNLQFVCLRASASLILSLTMDSSFVRLSVCLVVTLSLHQFVLCLSAPQGPSSCLSCANVYDCMHVYAKNLPLWECTVLNQRVRERRRETRPSFTKPNQTKPKSKTKQLETSSFRYPM